MKTSYKLFLTAVLIAIISVISYDLALRAEYRKGTYKSHFYGFDKTTDFNGFTKIDNRASNLISVRVEKGNEPGIWVKSVWKDRFKISRSGATLVINVANNQSTRVSAYDNSITIICPSLDMITTTPYLGKSGQNLIHSRGTTTLAGFNQQNLALNIGKASTIILERNTIKNLKAQVGDNSFGNSDLTINTGNEINSATVKVLGRSWLRLENPKITNRNFIIADSATVTMGGSFLNMINKP